MPASQDDVNQMDKAAEQAREELMKNFERWSARDLTAWWSTWYMRAGHKRLGRILVEIARAAAEKK